MTIPPIIIGREAVEHLVEQHPQAHEHFGDHDSIASFALVLTQPGALIMECDGCWMLTFDRGQGVRDVHWFCPGGARMKAIRRMITFLFTTSGTRLLVGITPEDHPNARRARILNRAVGAEPYRNGYVLTPQRFLCYSRETRTR